MATYTTNYGLHQWEASDDFLRTDFNTDFAKIDAALGEKADGEDLADKCGAVTGTYTGDGELTGWNLVDKNGNAVDLDDVADKCKVVKMDGNTLIIEVLDWAAFESPDGYTVNCLAKAGSAPSGDADKDTSSTSPDTGVSVAAAAVSAVCAGAAILALSKKKDAE